MSSVVKALLLNVEAFLADSGVRRSVGGFALNYSSADASVSTHQFTLNPGETKTLTVPGLGANAVVLRCTAPVVCDVTTSTPGSFQVPVAKCLVLDAPVTQMVISNPGTVASQIIFIQS